MKNNLLRVPCLGLVLLMAASNVKAQSISQIQYFVPQLSPRSPTTTALEKYGTYKVNEFTGVPDISIPLYTIEAGGLHLPITLSYHASGIKVTDVSSWVGAGWSVSSGGQITRKTMGIADDMPYGLLNGYLHQHSEIDPTTTDGINYLEYAATGVYDTKPDIYSYDFPDHGGKFFFDASPGQNYAVRKLPFAPIKISHSGNSFNIADEYGNNYLFGNNAIENTSTSTGSVSANPFISAWKITSMISQNRRDTVSFSYNSTSIVYPIPDAEIYSITDNITNYYTGNHYSTNYAPVPSSPGNFTSTDELLTKQINFKNGKVVFNLDDTLRQDISHGKGLKDITIYKYNFGTRTFEVQKSIKFWKSYFYNPTDYVKRLRLDSIQILDKAGRVIQHYRFDYNTAINLPDYTSKMIDYWGYFNNINNDYFTPQTTYYVGATGITFGSSIANGRRCDSIYMQANVLTGIHYPSGGYTTFTYQTNQYYDNHVLQLAGGLRIKTISSYDGTGAPPIVKTYVYNDSISRANYLLDYNYFRADQEHRYFSSDQITGVLQATCTVHTFYSVPHCDLEGYDGATVVYPSVTEYIGTPGNNIGRTDYIFRDKKDQTTDASRSGSLIYASYFFARGQLLSKKDYVRKSDGTYQPVKSVSNTYSAFAMTSYPNVGMNVFKQWYNEGAAGNPLLYPPEFSGDDKTAFQYPTYAIESDDNYLTETTTNTYDTNDTTKYTTSTVNYAYDDTVHQQVVQTVHTDSKGNTHISSNKHAYDYLSGGTTHNAVLDSIISRHMYSTVIEKTDSLRNPTTGVNGIIGAQLSQYKAGNVSNTIVPDKISTLSISGPLTNFSHSHVVSGALTADARYTRMITFDQYDDQNNITQYTPRNTTPMSILWNYQSELPEAQVKNATTGPSVSQVAYAGFEADNKGHWTYSGTPVFNSSAPSGTMVYPLSAGSVVSPTLPSGTAYILSYWTNGSAATVSNGSALTGSPITSANGWTQYEYQVPSGSTQVTVSGTVTIDELRLYPAAAQMTTYAYDPSGVRSISDAKGLNSYFEYDHAQRLRNSRDYLGNIISHYSYHMYDDTVGNDALPYVLSKNNCPINTTSSVLTYNVPLNTYWSSTKASANAQADYEAATDGQSLANATCACLTNVDVALTNTTGTEYQVNFSGHGNASLTYFFSGSKTIQVPTGTYDVEVYPSSGTVTRTFEFTGQPTQFSTVRVSYNSVSITSGSAITISVY